jgi:TetR/AcrR family transcriptional regulator, transcriptional repressor for nem operon
MRVSRAQAAANRNHVIDVASQLFREHGFDGIGLKDLMAAAGLTQGAFYKQFASKDDLIAQASAKAIEASALRWAQATAAKPKDPLGAIAAFYLSDGHRNARMEGCPFVALAADAARQGSDVKAVFEDGIKRSIEMLSGLIAKSGGTGKATRRAMAVLSTMVGAVTLARAINDEKMASQILQAAAENVLSTISKPGMGRS